MAGFRAPGESPTNFNDFVPVTIAVSLLHASDEEPPASHVPEAKAFSFAPVEQDEPNCDDNLPPSADAGGPYQATLVIGDPFPIIHFDASNSIDADGTIDEYLWEFGDDGVGCDWQGGGDQYQVPGPRGSCSQLNDYRQLRGQSARIRPK